jgi:hypothetical protein
MGALRALLVVTAALHAHPSLAPARVAVGERVVAEAVVTIDPKRIDPASVRVSFGVAPLAALGPVEQNGLRFRVVAACLDESCVPDAKPRTVRLTPVRVIARTRDGRPVSASFAWPQLVLVPRVPAAALRGNPPLRLETTPPAPRYSIAPGTLAALFDAAAVLIALAAAGMVVLLRRRAAARRAELDRDPLDRALELVRESARRPPADRRRALNFLADVLHGRRPALVDDVEALAWSRPPPSAEAAEELADDVEQAVRRP